MEELKQADPAVELAANDDRLHIDLNAAVRQAFAMADAKRACRRVPALIPQRRGTIRRMARIGRNDPCPCGSGQKAKRCCL